jgi:hypothetical protein
VTTAENGQAGTTGGIGPVLLASEDIETIVLQTGTDGLAIGHPKEERNLEGTGRRGNRARPSPEDTEVIEIDMIAAIERCMRYDKVFQGLSTVLPIFLAEILSL